MNKMTFDEMLCANGLPPVGEIVTTPHGDKAEIIGYSFTDKLKIHAKFEGVEIEWLPEQVKLCTWGQSVGKKIVRHITTDCCYYTEEDGKTVIVCGARLTPELDGKLWEEVSEYKEKEIVPSNPNAAKE